MNSKIIVSKVKKSLKMLLSTYNKKKAAAAISCQAEIDENAANEALEARLAALVATAPAYTHQTLLSLRLQSGDEMTVYTGCQMAGAQTR